jgi:hypothetical protein
MSHTDDAETTVDLSFVARRDLVELLNELGRENDLDALLDDADAAADQLAAILDDLDDGPPGRRAES